LFGKVAIVGVCTRRRLLAETGAGIVAVLAAGCGATTTSTGARNRSTALVYRGPASCRGCSDAVAALLGSPSLGFHTVYCGPGERMPLSAAALAGAAVFAQPGGGDLVPAWGHLHAHREQVREFVGAGGAYLGFCLGGYLAGFDPGYALLPAGADSDEYRTAPDAAVHSAADAVIPISWRGRRRHVYFQDGPCFRISPAARPRVEVLARYTNGLPAALVCDFGAGRVGVVGPHPEADRSWYADAGLVNPDGVRFDLGRDLVTTTLHAHPR
jgi:hypothetical protein